MTTVEFDCSENLQEGKEYDYMHFSIIHGANFILKGMYIGDKGEHHQDVEPLIELEKEDAIHLAKTILAAYGA